MLLQEIIFASLCLNMTTCPDDEYFGKANQHRNHNRRLQELSEKLKNETLNVVTIHYPPFSKVNGNVGEGVAFKVFEAIREQYGFKYQIEPKEERLVSVLSVLELFGNTTDMVVAMLPIFGKLTPKMRYSIAMVTIPWHVVMKRPKLSASGSGLMQPFTGNVWLLIIVTLLAVGPIFYGLIFIQAKFRKDVDFRQITLPSCMWFVYGAILKQGSTLNPVTDSSRIFFASWWIFIMVLTAFYTANLTAYLTLNTFTLPINDVKDIGKKKYTWCTGVNLLDEMTNKPNSDLSISLKGSVKKRITNMETYNVLEDFVLKKDYLFIAEKQLIDDWIFKYYQDKHSTECPFAITEWAVLVTPVAFAYSLDFPYIDLFNTALQSLIEAGLINFWLSEFLPQADVCPLNPKVKDRRLKNADLMLTYYIVAAGFSVALLIFCFEMGSMYFNKRRRRHKIVQAPNNIIFTTPPPPYHSLFAPPYSKHPEYDVKRREVNGRDYWCVTSANTSRTQLIPVRAPSAVLYHYTKY